MKPNSKAVLPCPELRRVLLPAFSPCQSFKNGPCKGTVRIDPQAGYTPAGFCGAIGKPEDVKLIVVVAEPGDPHQRAQYPPETPNQTFDRVSQYAFNCFNEGKDVFHRNLRDFLNMCWPEEREDRFARQLRHTWITEAVLCAAPREGGYVPAGVRNECGRRYLVKQLEVLPEDVIIVALGGKAQQRIKRVYPGAFHKALSIAPPGCYRRTAKSSWASVAECIRPELSEFLKWFDKTPEKSRQGQRPPRGPGQAGRPQH